MNKHNLKSGFLFVASITVAGFLVTSGATQVFAISTNSPPTISYSPDAGYINDGVNPDGGFTNTNFTFKIVYTDADNDPPTNLLVAVYNGGTATSTLLMSPDTDASVNPTLRDENYRNGEQYMAISTFSTGNYSYIFYIGSDVIFPTTIAPTFTVSSGSSGGGGGGGIPQPLPDLSIERIKPIQVVEGSDINDDGRIDLVAQKPTIIRVRPRLITTDTLNNNQIVKVELSFQNNLQSINKSIGEIKNIVNDQNGYIDFFVTPTQTGESSLSVTIDKDNSVVEQDETNNLVVQELDIKKTNNLRLAYIPFTFPSSPENFLETSLRSTEFIDATYPVADVLGEYSTTEFVPGLLGRVGNEGGVVSDLLGFWTWGKLQYPTSDQIFGVVSHDYFAYHNMGTTVGVHSGILLNAVSLITDDYWTAAAHELGHAHGLWMVGPEEYDLYDGGRDAWGYWVRNQTEIKNGQCFMGSAGDRESFFYNNDTPVWVDNEDYEVLFKERLQDKTDPEILLLSGWVEQDGTIFINPLYRTNGNIDEISGDEYTLNLLDFDGNLIDSFGFDVSFELRGNPPVEVDIAPFAFTIPYHDNIWQVNISKQGEIVTEVDAPTRLLHDAIDSIPETGFAGKEQQRKALHNKVDALEKQIESKNYIGAVEKLKNDIRKKVNEWLTDYQKETPLVLTKEEILKLIDSLIQSIANNTIVL